MYFDSRTYTLDTYTSMLKVNCMGTNKVEEVAVKRQKILTLGEVLEVC